MVYIHPWELDPDQPRMNSISRKWRFRHYVNLHKTESKFKNLLADFGFSSIFDVLSGRTAVQQDFASNLKLAPWNRELGGIGRVVEE